MQFHSPSSKKHNFVKIFDIYVVTTFFAMKAQQVSV